MKDITTIGIDIAKNIFQLHGKAWKAVNSRSVSPVVGLSPSRPFGLGLRHTLQNGAEALPGNEPVEQRQAVAQQIQFPQSAVSGEESCLPYQSCHGCSSFQSAPYILLEMGSFSNFPICQTSSTIPTDAGTFKYYWSMKILPIMSQALLVSASLATDILMVPSKP